MSRIEIPVLIYNLFPRLAGNFLQWSSHLERIKKMGFNWIYINPFQYPGFSGSLYAIKDYFSFNPIFVDEKSRLTPLEQLKSFLDSAHNSGLNVAMDLVVSHTAKDHPFVRDYPYWYKKNEKGEVKSPGAWDNGKWVEWGDLAEIDNETTVEKEKLWNYWYELILFYINLGFDGFRADAAYAVPEALWKFLISGVKNEGKNIIFFAESLGCPLEKTLMLSKAGFDFIFNSSKWWNYKDKWLIEQYELTRKHAPSISFPESHDTERLYGEAKNFEEFKQRLIFTCFFSTGWMIPIGFEYGFKKKLDVCKTSFSDWEETNINLTELIRDLIKIKNRYRVLKEEGAIKNFLNFENVTFLFKSSIDEKEKIIFVINTLDRKVEINLKNYPFAGEKYKDILSDELICLKRLELFPFDIKIFLELNSSWIE